MVLVSIWAISVVAILPTIFFTGTYDGLFPETSLVIYTACAERWPYPSLHLVYSIALMFIQYIIPIAVIIVTHAKIIKTVRQRTQAPSFRLEPRRELTKRNKKTTKILLTIAAAFGIHWLPYHIYTIGMEMFKMLAVDVPFDSDVELILFFVVHSFAVSSVITNPILYGWLNTNLKHLFRAMIPHLKSERFQRQSQQEAMAPEENLEVIEPDAMDRGLCALHTNSPEERRTSCYKMDEVMNHKIENDEEACTLSTCNENTSFKEPSTVVCPRLSKSCQSLRHLQRLTFSTRSCRTAEREIKVRL